MWPNQVCYPTDWSFASGCSPKGFSAPQLPPANLATSFYRQGRTFTSSGAPSQTHWNGISEHVFLCPARSDAEFGCVEATLFLVGPAISPHCLISKVPRWHEIIPHVIGD